MAFVISTNRLLHRLQRAWVMSLTAPLSGPETQTWRLSVRRSRYGDAVLVEAHQVSESRKGWFWGHSFGGMAATSQSVSWLGRHSP